MTIETTKTIEIPTATAPEHVEAPGMIDAALEDIESTGYTATDPEAETYHYQVEPDMDKRRRYLICGGVGCIAIGVCVFIVIPLIIFLAVWLTGMQHIKDSDPWTNNNGLTNSHTGLINDSLLTNNNGLTNSHSGLIHDGIPTTSNNGALISGEDGIDLGDIFGDSNFEDGILDLIDIDYSNEDLSGFEEGDERSFRF